jgi:hypothetical protein
MSLDKAKVEAALRGLDVTATRESGKNNHYVIINSDVSLVNDMAPQAQLVWKAVVAVCNEMNKKHFTDNFVEEVGDQLVERGFWAEDYKQSPLQIFRYYRSMGSKTGRPGFVARRLLSVR